MDRLAKEGNIHFYQFPTPDVGTYEFSFSGLKTALLYLVRDGLEENEHYIEDHLNDLCASYQHRIITILLDKLEVAANAYQVQHLAIAGGVSANSELRKRFLGKCEATKRTAHIPEFVYCTDNAAMIGIAAYYKYQAGIFADEKVKPFARGGAF